VGGARGRGDFQLTGFQTRLRALLPVHCHQTSRLHKSHKTSFLPPIIPYSIHRQSHSRIYINAGIDIQWYGGRAQYTLAQKGQQSLEPHLINRARCHLRYLAREPLGRAILAVFLIPSAESSCQLTASDFTSFPLESKLISFRSNAAS